MSKSPEHDLQTRCVIWFHYRFPHLKPLFFSVPNGGYRNKAEAARLKAEGAKPECLTLYCSCLPENGQASTLR